jgi:hypothetical protein
MIGSSLANVTQMGNSEVKKRVQWDLRARCHERWLGFARHHGELSLIVMTTSPLIVRSTDQAIERVLDWRSRISLQVVPLDTSVPRASVMVTGKEMIT